MKDNQNIFYTSISKYYSEIFPYKPMQLDFVKKQAGELDGKQILDVGCATGELAFHLAKEGATVTGIDLNPDLLRQAKAQKQHEQLHFQRGNMLEIKNDFEASEFDAVLCFGNTLVHLPDERSVSKMFEGVYSVLKPGGLFLIQILNYDYILDEQLSELPPIETENIKFIRKYSYNKNAALIDFQTKLHLKKEEETIINTAKLFALKSSELTSLLTQAGFKNIQLFANFKSGEFGGKHLPLVASCLKK